MHLFPRLRSVVLLSAFFGGSIAAQGDSVGSYATVETPLIRLAIDDLPGLLSQWENGRLGPLFAREDVQGVVRRVSDVHRARLDGYKTFVDRALERQLGVNGFALFLRALMPLDRSELHSAWYELGVANDGRRARPQFFAGLEPTKAARAAIWKRLDGLVCAGKIQRILGWGDLWTQRTERQWAMGMDCGMDQVQLQSVDPVVPGVRVEAGVAVWLQLFLADLPLLSPEVAEDARRLVELVGLANVDLARWELRADGDRVRDEISLDLDGPAQGLLAAVVDGMAPLPEQPLPEGALLQVRLSVDVPKLMDAVNGMLEVSQSAPLPESLCNDLRKGWTGGVSLAVVRPRPGLGNLIPRIYVSFGVTDQAALSRVIAAVVPNGGGIRWRDAEYEGTPVTRLTVAGAPAALQPTWGFKNGDLHVAESPRSMRDLLKAEAAGRGGIDIEGVPRPSGKGVQPGFDVRFDERAIYRALHEIWLPLAAIATSAETRNDAAVRMGDLPRPDDIEELLVVGRGVLLRDGGLSIAMTGTAGGPEMFAALAGYGPVLSAFVEEGYDDTLGRTVRDVREQHRSRLQGALAGLKARVGAWPATLAELAAQPELAGQGLLLSLGDTSPMDVLDGEGKKVAASSYRYYPKGLPIVSTNEITDAVLIETRPAGLTRTFFDLDGAMLTVYGYGGHAQIEDIEKAGQAALAQRAK